MVINGEDYIEAYFVMPLATCSGPVLISQEDIGQMTSGTFFVISGNVCLTSARDRLNSQINNQFNKRQNLHNLQLTSQNVSILNCGYFDPTILY